MITQYSNVHKMYETTETSLSNSLSPKMHGSTPDSLGVKLPAGDMMWFDKRGGDAEFNSMQLTGLPSEGNVRADANGNIIIGESDGVKGPASSEDGNVAGFDGTDGNTIKDLGFKLTKNDDFGLIEYTTDDGCLLKLTYDDVIPFYNDTGVDLDAGTVMHLVGGAVVGSEVLPTFEKADASDWEKVQGTVGLTTCDVLIGETGFIGVKGQFKDINTSGVSGPIQIWISATIPGSFTDIKPTFPNYSISIGGAVDSDVNGEVLVNITSSYTDTYHESWDGAIRESFDFRVDASAGVVTGTLKNVDPTRNLTLLLSDGFYTLDTTSADLDIVLTAGTDEVVQTNYVYIPKGLDGSAKVLTVNTTGYPETEHCKVATIDCQSASDIEDKGGARGNQNKNDHIKKETDNGHILHIAEWIRRQYATIDPRDGCEVTLDATAGDGYISMTSGKVSQLHLQTVDSLTMPTVPIMAANDFTTPFLEYTNLNTINAFSDGSSWNNKWGKIVVWVIANKTGEPSFLGFNLPRAGTTSSDTALTDSANYADYSIPAEYKSKAVLLGAFVINVSSGTLTYNGGYQDLRGTIPSNIAGGGGGAGGVTSYLALTDTPNSFVGQAGKFPQVNSVEDALVFSDGAKNRVIEYHKSGSVNGNVVIPLNEGTSYNNGKFMNATGTLSITKIEVTLGNSSSSTSSQIDVELREYSLDNGTAYSLGNGTIVGSSTSFFALGVSAPSLFYRAESNDVAYDMVAPSSILFCEVDTGTYTTEDLTVTVYYTEIEA